MEFDQTRYQIDDDDMTGQVLSDRYRLIELIGEGGMGLVYKAEHIHMRKTLAVKILHPELTTVEEVVQRFEREAQAAANIDHPNVCAATDFGRAKSGAFFLVMEFLEGKSVSDLLKEEGSLSVRRALKIGGQMCAALSRAHNMGIIHRDLKPENVLLIERDGEQDFVKVLDFGIARVPIVAEGSQSQTLTRAGYVMGTPAYLSPEQASGSAVDHRADLYSLGIVLFEMVAGRRPFHSSSTVELIGMHVTRPAPSLNKVSKEKKIPKRLERLVDSLLAKEASLRPASAEEVRLELAAIEHDLDRAKETSEAMSGRLKDASIRIKHVATETAERLAPVAKEVKAAAPDAIPLLKKFPKWIWAVVAANFVLGGLTLLGFWGWIWAEDPPEIQSQFPVDPELTPVPAQILGGSPPTLPVAVRSSLEKIRSRPDIEAILKKRAFSPRQAVNELEDIYDREKLPEIAFILAETEAIVGQERAALRHAELALDGNAEFANDPGMRGFILRELGRRNHNLAEDLIKDYYMPGAISDLEGLACSANKRKGRRRAQSLLRDTDSLDRISPYCKLTIELERARGCEERHKIVKQMAHLNDPRSLPALERLRPSRKSGRGGRRFFRGRRSSKNSCLAEDLEAAIQHLKSIRD